MAIFTPIVNGQSIDASTFNNPMTEIADVVEAGLVHIQTIDLASPSSGASFTSIPATFRDLVLYVSERPSAAASKTILMRFNADTTTYYSQSNAVSAAAGSTITTNAATYFNMDSVRVDYLDPANMFNALKIEISNYSDTGKYKTISFKAVVPKASENDIIITQGGGYWAKTSAVNQIFLGSSFATGTKVELYGRGLSA